MDTDDYETYDEAISSHKRSETFEEAVPARKVSDSFEEPAIEPSSFAEGAISKVEETKEEIVEAAK